MVKIVIQPSGMCCLNVGDQAMLETAYTRLRSFWPEAEISVITWAPDEIRRTLPGAIPLAPEGRKQCFDSRLFGRLSAPCSPVSRIFDRLENLTIERTPNLQALAARAKMKLRGHTDGVRIVRALEGTDVFVFSGAGIVTDAFAQAAIEGLETMLLARRFGARTAIIGHMFGPVTDPELKAACDRVLPKVDLITVREKVSSLPFLASCGVNLEKVRVTGDETLEFVLENPKRRVHGNVLGINVRAAFYSGIERDRIPVLSTAIHKIRTQLGARLEPLAVAHHSGDDDAAALAMLGAQPESDSQGPESPEAFKQRIAKCRLVITGSYHAAVFALAQGIPALGLVFAPYYEAKFKGLQDLFGPGCRYVDGRQPGWDQELEMISAELWRNAHYWEDELLESAGRLASEGRAAYEELRTIVEGKTANPGGAIMQTFKTRVASEGA